jgi:hypothetical protein
MLFFALKTSVIGIIEIFDKDRGNGKVLGKFFETHLDNIMYLTFFPAISNVKHQMSLMFPLTGLTQEQFQDSLLAVHNKRLVK